MKKVLTKISAAVFIALGIFLLSAFALPVVPAQADSTPEYWAVIAGVSNYQNIGDLDYCDDDAQELSDVLSPVWGSSHIRLLIDSQATKANILDAIDWLAYNAGADDTVLFSFSGHGSDDGDGYFYPYNSLTYSYSNDISSSQLASALQSVNAGKIVVILDICHAGSFQYNLSNYGRVILMGCRTDETSIDSWDLQNGVFTHYILQAIDEFEDADTDYDYELSAEEVAEYAYTRTYQYDYSQHPVTDDYYYGELALLAKFVFALNTSLPYGTTVLTLDGTDYTSEPSPMLWIPGTSHTISVPELVDRGAGTRYVFIQWNDGSIAVTRMISGGAYTANYDKEQLLDVISDFGETQGSGWYKDGTWAYFSVTEYIELPDTRHYFASWSGDYWGAEASTSILMDGPKTIAANWWHEYLLTINSAYGTPIGAGWYDEGETAGFSVTPYIELPDTKHYFTGWSGGYVGTSYSASIVMSDPKVISADWRHEYLLTLNSEYGEPAGAGWYNEGDTASFSVEPVQGVIIRQIFDGWSGDLTDTEADSSVLMSSPRVVTANWRTDYIQLYLLIGGVVVVGGAIITTVVLVRKHRQAV